MDPAPSARMRGESSPRRIERVPGESEASVPVIGYRMAGVRRRSRWHVVRHSPNSMVQALESSCFRPSPCTLGLTNNGVVGVADGDASTSGTTREQGGSTLPEENSLDNMRRSRAIRRIGLGLLLIVVVMALLGWAGPRPSVASAEATGYRLAVEPPVGFSSRAGHTAEHCRQPRGWIRPAGEIDPGEGVHRSARLQRDLPGRICTDRRRRACHLGVRPSSGGFVDESTSTADMSRALRA